MTYDPAIVRYDALVRFFFEMHDPTIDRRNKGGQYRSSIFYHTADQQVVAEGLWEHLWESGYAIKTSIEPATTFWQAEERHQQYCEKRGIVPKSFRKVRFTTAG